MEVIRIAGYTEEEKTEIARKHLIANAIKKHGLSGKEWSVTDEALQTLVRRYTREAGVRNLEREISNTVRKGVKDIVLTGRLSTLEPAAGVFEGLNRMFDVNFMIPVHSQFGTVIGAALGGK
jgi:ATP-dependent Lon protease